LDIVHALAMHFGLLIGAFHHVILPFSNGGSACG